MSRSNPKNPRPAAILRSYLKELARISRQGDAREESFYPALAELLKEAARALGLSHIQVTVQPRPTEAGNPDFRVWDGRTHIVGYLEAKHPLVRSLDQVVSSDQLRRYLSTFPNLILTNFLEFRLYRNGEEAMTAQLARPVALQLGQTPPLEGADQTWKLLEAFFSFSLPRSFTAEQLAVELAKRTWFLREIVWQQLQRELAAKEGHLLGFYEAFQQFLIGTLRPEEFADLYAQTITYGLFAARARARNANDFTRRQAEHLIPRSIGVLRDLFRFISWQELPAEIAWIVDDIAAVLAAADVHGTMDRFWKLHQGKDPVVHFYETFLARYDPEERERRGVYYTPDPVVSYIVRSLHHLLREKFGLRYGLASQEVTLLDPAAGTMTFVARAAEKAVQEYRQKYGDGVIPSLIQEHILRHFYAFELMVAPYTVGHMKMAFFLEELGYRLADNERVPFYLTNTLDMSELAASRLPGLSSLAEESHHALEVKGKIPILVILGNPPYSGHSANKGEWILRQIEVYKQVDGKPLGEKNPKWLQDDYVKFIRFAQWKIEQAGRGVIGFITNHSYLDNPTFRGMRRSLMQTFDEIYLLDLHGNALKRERCPDGSPDENVFDIRQGVAIAFFVKTGNRANPDARVFHADLWGRRETKYEWLETHDVSTTSWTEIRPRPEFYLFKPIDETLLPRYENFLSITSIFSEYQTGVIAGRDNLAIHFTEEDLWKTITVFSQMDSEIARRAFKLGKDARDWKVKWAQQDLQESGLDRNKIVAILYRPFDVRYTYYTGKNKGFIRWAYPQFMRHMLVGENVALIVPKQNKGDFGAFVTATIGTHKTVAAFDINSYFPLYLYPEAERRGMFQDGEPGERRTNLNPKILEALSRAYGREVHPEEVFHYIYAVLYAPSYRKKYADFLRLDFPRIPFPAHPKVFEQLADLGRRLVDLHLLRASELDPPVARYEGKGDDRVAKNAREGFRYDPQSERVYINRNQYFAPVPLEVWEYTIGGYQVAHKWLKDRKGRILTLNEIRTYCRIITALKKTIALQEEIDEAYSRVEQNLLKFS